MTAHQQLETFLRKYEPGIVKQAKAIHEDAEIGTGLCGEHACTPKPTQNARIQIAEYSRSKM